MRHNGREMMCVTMTVCEMPILYIVVGGRHIVDTADLYSISGGSLG